MRLDLAARAQALCAGGEIPAARAIVRQLHCPDRAAASPRAPAHAAPPPACRARAQAVAAESAWPSGSRRGARSPAARHRSRFLLPLLHIAVSGCAPADTWDQSPLSALQGLRIYRSQPVCRSKTELQELVLVMYYQDPRLRAAWPADLVCCAQSRGQADHPLGRATSPSGVARPSQTIDEQTPADLDIPIIAYNYATP